MDEGSQVFKVYLMDNPSSRRHDPEVVKGFLCPAEDCITLSVAFKLLFLVFPKGICRAVRVNLNRVVNDQVSRDYRVDFSRVPSKALHCRAEGCKVNYCWNARKVLHDYP
ncbi:hypothetical protein DSECCO2_592440 [anaerobic digester metagenome]